MKFTSFHQRFQDVSLLVCSECSVYDDLICASGSALSTEITVSSTRSSSSDDYGTDRACLYTVDEPITERGWFPFTVVTF